jgi:hypothetical protein
MKDHHPKSISTFALFALLQIFVFYPSLSFAMDVWSFPIESELKTLVATNLRSQAKDLWLAGPNLESETHFQIPAYGSLEIPLDDFKAFAWLQAGTAEAHSLDLQLQTSFEGLVFIAPDQTTMWKVRARAGSELVVFNQAPFSQKVSVRAGGILWKEFVLSGFEKSRISVGALAGQVLSLEGEARFGGLLLAGADSLALSANSKPAVLKSSAPSARYFRLSDSSGSQSYVVALQDPGLIDQAVKQIQLPWQTNYLPRILVARVTSGSGGFNRDFSSAWKAPWSWHVAEVYRFADFASQGCDGNPLFLEQTLGTWSPDDQGAICFWNYRIVEELSLSQVETGK